MHATINDQQARKHRFQHLVHARAVRRWVMMVIVALLFLAGALLVQAWQAGAQPQMASVPRSERFGPALTLDEMIVRMQQRITRNNDDHDAFAQLGLLFLQRVRSRGDAADYTRADQALTAALAREPLQVDALVGKGVLALALHDFQGALQWAEQAREINPLRPDILGILTDAYVELGDYDAAVTTLQAMMDLRPGVNAYARTAYLRELHGDVEGAIAAMQLAAETSWPGDEPALWTTVQLGNLHFNRGDLALAASTYQAALSHDPEYVYARAGMARVWAAQGRIEEAVAAYRQVVARNPLPEFAIALGELLEATGDITGAQEQYALVELMQALNAEAGMNVDLEMALFAADHGEDKAAALAQAETAYATRPSIYAADVLAWALYHNGQADAARVYMEEAMRLGTQDARLYYHAGMIALAKHEKEDARQFLTRALAINPYFSPLYAADAAATLAMLE